MKFIRNLKEMVSLYKYEIIALQEPRISSEVADHVMIGRRNWVNVKADNLGCNTSLLCDGDHVEIRVIHTHKQFIHLVIAANTKEE